MKDWREYIEQKFVPKENYEFDYRAEEFNEFIIGTIKITHKKTETWFKFENAYGDWEFLSLVQYGNPKSKCCPETYEFDEGIYEDSVREMNDFLRPAFDGWSSRDYYLADEYFKSIFYDNPNFQGSGELYRGKKGMFSFILESKFNGKVESVTIDPIKK